MDYDNFIKLVRARHSCRSYKTDEVPDELISKCIEASRVSPSACNKQPWRFIIVKDKELRQKICSEGVLPGVPMPWMKDAPVLVAICALTDLTVHKFASFLSKVDYRQIDIGIAGEHFVLAAQSLGLGSCWIGWFKEKKVKKILNIPWNVKVLSLFTLGYPSEIREQPKKLTLEKIYFREKWQ
ncbi:MAG TPA: NAD(P)H nitroreductase [Lentisphaeria bacterium]|nr:MAG: hypothetical protein A2X47_12355 [Lentisphaerae bacterium GWF2_38_69]HBM17200.1 NAD(P)H nitroreductase [Lentisphaeria bacterium]